MFLDIFTLTDPFFWAALGAYFGLHAFYKGFVAFKHRRVLEDLPPSKIRSLAVGYVEVQGRAHMEPALLAPFSQKPVICYKVKVEELKISNDSSRSEPLYQGNSNDRPFYLEDETGKVLVYPEGAEIDMPETFHLVTSKMSEIPEGIRQYLHNQSVHLHNPDATLQFTETSLSGVGSFLILGTYQVRAENTHCIAKDPSGSNWFRIANQDRSGLHVDLGLATLCGIYGGPVLFLICFAYMIHNLFFK